jgi:HAD superfamily hydrolase (TIGR01509 family)
MIKNILFDLDGVLFDGCEFHANIFLKAINQIVPGAVSKEYHDKYLNGLSTKQKLQHLVQNGIIDDSNTQYISNLKQSLTVSELENYIKTNFKLIEICTYLQNKNINLFCVSNSIKKTIIKCLSGLGILHFFIDIISSEDVKNPKPNPEPYILAMKKNKIIPLECLIIEDSPFGIEAANKSGAHVLIISNPAELTLDLLKSKII